MGIDCVIKIGKTYTRLDRWYVFSDSFVPGKVYGKRFVVEKLEKRMKPFVHSKQGIPLFLNEVKGIQKEAMQHEIYVNHWLLVALHLTKKAFDNSCIVFYTDDDLPDGI